MAVSVKERFNKLHNKRITLLERNYECSRLTIPFLFPRDTHKESDVLPTPYQSLGAQAVNNLAAKLLLTLLPPNAPFFRLDVDEQVIQQLMKELGQQNYKTQVDDKLSKYERAIQNYLETASYREPVFRALKLLIVTGNALCYFPQTDSATMRVFKLNEYVCARDGEGNILEIVIKERLAVSSLEDGKLKEHVLSELSKDKEDNDNEIDLYTRVVKQDDGLFYVSQEVLGEEVESSSGSYSADNLPWIVLRWSSVDNENYGRGHVEEYLGDLMSLEELNKAMVEASASCAKIVFMVKPGSATHVQDLVRANNLDFVSGDTHDVGILQVQKNSDLQVVQAQIAEYSSRISQTFLMNRSVQRQAERVTAEEVRQMVSELEHTLGGIYSILSQEFQRPFLNNIMNKMRDENKLPPLPKNLVKFSITTGLESLGRGNDLSKINLFISNIGALGPQVISQYLNVSEFIARVGTSLGIDTEGLIKSEDDIQAQQKQQMMQELAQKAGPGLAQEIAKGTVQQQLQQNQQAQ